MSVSSFDKENQGRFKTGIGYYHYMVNDDDEWEFAKGQLTRGREMKIVCEHTAALCILGLPVLAIRQGLTWSRLARQ